MNLGALYELKEQLEAAAVYGSGLMAEDFRLKKAVGQMEPLAKAAPVFRKIEQAVGLALSPDCSDRPGALMDALALVNAVACTQGTAGTEGELMPLAGETAKQEAAGSDGGFGESLRNIPYSRLAPLEEAFRGSGSGRYAVIVKALKEPEICSDWRMVDLLIRGLGDSYGEISAIAARQLLELGTGILPRLLSGFDPKGKREMLLRLELIGKLAGSGQNELYRKAALDGEKSVKEEAIGLLRMDGGNVPFLLDLLKTEKGALRNRVLWALSFMDMEDPSEYLAAMKKKKPSEAAQILCGADNERSADLTAELLEQLKQRIEKEAEEAAQEYERVGRLLKELGRNGTLADGTTAAQLKKQLSVLAKKKDRDIWKRERSERPDMDETEEGKIWRAAEGKHSKKLFDWMKQSYESFPGLFPPLFFYDSLCVSPCREMFGFVEEMFRAFGEEKMEEQGIGGGLLEAEFLRTLLTEPPEAAYDRFSSLLRAESGKASAILQVFWSICYSQEKERYVVYGPARREDGKICAASFETLDRRWYDLLLSAECRKLVKKKDFRIRTRSRYGTEGYYQYMNTERENGWGIMDFLLSCLYCPKIGGLPEAYREYFGRLMRAGVHVDVPYLDILNRCGFSDYEFLVEKILKENRTQYLWHVENMLERVPLPSLELSNIIGRVLERDEKDTIVGKDKIKAWQEQLASGAKVGELI